MGLFKKFRLRRQERLAEETRSEFADEMLQRAQRRPPRVPPAIPAVTCYECELPTTAYEHMQFVSARGRVIDRYVCQTCVEGGPTENELDYVRRSILGEVRRGADDD